MTKITPILDTQPPSSGHGTGWQGFDRLGEGVGGSRGMANRGVGVDEIGKVPPHGIAKNPHVSGITTDLFPDSEPVFHYHCNECDRVVEDCYHNCPVHPESVLVYK